MPIVLACVDERLIHGSVSVSWAKAYDADRIVVVNDEAIEDEVAIAALKLAKPHDLLLSILSLDKAVKNFSSDRYKDDNVYLITKDIDDIAEIIARGVDIEQFNISNVSKEDGYTKLTETTFLNDEDIQTLRDLKKKGIRVTIKSLPNSVDVSNKI